MFEVYENIGRHPLFNHSRILIFNSACPSNTYKSGTGNEQCRQCPSNSVSAYSTADRDRCDCQKGYARAPGESPDAPCTTTPSAPLDLQVQASSTNATLEWRQPADLGGRDDTEYVLNCQECQQGTEYCSQCTSSVRYQKRTRDLSVIVTGLSADSRYKFKVNSLNTTAILQACR